MQDFLICGDSRASRNSVDVIFGKKLGVTTDAQGAKMLNAVTCRCSDFSND